MAKLKAPAKVFFEKKWTMRVKWPQLPKGGVRQWGLGFRQCLAAVLSHEPPGGRSARCEPAACGPEVRGGQHRGHPPPPPNAPHPAARAGGGHRPQRAARDRPPHLGARHLRAVRGGRPGGAARCCAPDGGLIGTPAGVGSERPGIESRRDWAGQLNWVWILPSQTQGHPIPWLEKKINCEVSITVLLRWSL